MANVANQITYHYRNLNIQIIFALTQINKLAVNNFPDLLLFFQLSEIILKPFFVKYQLIVQDSF